MDDCAAYRLQNDHSQDVTRLNTAIDIMARQLPASSQDDSSAQSSSPENLTAFNRPRAFVQPSDMGSSTGQQLVGAGGNSLAGWLDRYQSLLDRPMPQEATASPTSYVHSRHAACPPRAGQTQWQSLPFSPTSDHGYFQTTPTPAQGAIGNVKRTPTTLDYEASLVPEFVLNLFPTHPTVQGAESSAPFTANTLAPRPQEAGVDVYARSFVVSSVDPATPHHTILEILPIKQYHSLRLVCLKYIADNHMFALSFGVLPEAIDAMNKFQGSNPGWRIRAAAHHDIAAITRVSEFIRESPQGLFGICVHVPPERSRDPYIEDFIKDVTGSFGAMDQFVDFLFEVTPGESPSPPLPSTFFQQRPVTPHECNSGAPETLPNIGEGKVDPNEQIIRLARIERGLDVRTTMQVMEVVNRTSRGAYDFLYLRMEWRAHVNFGYAFVNFVDPLDIIDLYTAIAGKKWPGVQFAEDPVKICYAMVQGKDNLVNRFRNSNVMTRPHDERPKLFHTSGPLAGSEAPFPSPNDRNRLRRSVASTAQHGVYVNGSRGQITTGPRHKRNRSNTPNTSATMNSRTSNRVTAGQSSSQNISTDSPLVLCGNQTICDSADQSLFQNVPSGSPSAGAERSLRHSWGHSSVENLGVMSFSAGFAASPVRHSWGPQSTAQELSSAEDTFLSTWESK
ncbi:hypothetical protein N7461_003093 [Penicillium sp. DV-2018c]|nr:hypothetical protein N7461_003093 [Penicillium sp. DV-2018c]